ncbi:MAG: dehydrogenase [Paludibacteraceae bacterium]|nr:dehydrogenase [Paludibacteraceae bacterium]
MADNYLEKRREAYEQEKQRWLKRQGKTNASREQQNPWSD